MQYSSFFKPARNISYLEEAKKFADNLVNNNDIQGAVKKHATLLSNALCDITNLEKTKTELKALTRCKCYPIEEIACYCYALAIYNDPYLVKNIHLLQDASDKLIVATNFRISNYVDQSGESEQIGKEVKVLAGFLLNEIKIKMSSTQVLQGGNNRGYPT